MHVSNYFMTPPSMELADRLTEATGFDTVFFCNSGAEANEGMFKLRAIWLVEEPGQECHRDPETVIPRADDHHGHGDGEDNFHRFFGPFTRVLPMLSRKI